MAKQTRKEFLRQEDPFLAFMKRAGVWFQSNMMAAISVAGVLAVAVVAVVVFQEVDQASRVEGAGHYFEAASLVEAEVSETGTSDGDVDAVVFPSQEEKERAIAIRFREAADQAGGGVGNLARLQAGVNFAEAGAETDAKKSFEASLAGMSPTDPLFYLATARVANGLESEKKFRDALDLWERVKAPAALEPRVLMAKARLWRLAGDPKRSRNLYDRVVQEFEQHAVRQEAEEILRTFDQPAAVDDVETSDDDS